MASHKKSPRVATPTQRENTPLLFLLLLLTLCFGGYYTWSVLLCGFVLCLLLLFTVWRQGHLLLPVGVESWPLYGLTALSLVSLPWAISAGMAFAGSLRWIVALLFFLYACTYSHEERTSILDTIGYVGAVMAACSLLSFLWQAVSGAENANGRIDGFFQYANTYGLFLTACLVLLLLKKTRRAMDYPAMAVLLCTIFLSGSRGVFLLAGGAALFLGVRTVVKTRNPRPLLIGVALLIAAGAIATLMSGGLVLRRLAAITLQSSSLNGRLLYYLDGLKMIWEHPMGIGQGGYIYLQPLYQTGIYTLQSIHNEYLQAALDSGILAGILLLALPLCLCLRKGLALRERLVILLIALHACIDFDFQFSAVLLLLLLCGSGGKARAVRPPRRLVPVAGGLLAALLLYFTLPYGLSFLGQAGSAHALWPMDLSLTEQRLQQCADMDEAEAVADRILSATDLSMLAWDCKFAAAAERGDYDQMVDAKYHYLRLNKYRPQVYEDFVTLLENACTQPDSQAHMTRYKTLAKGTEELIMEVCSQTSPLAYRIADQPDLSFGADILIKLQIIKER